MGQRIWFTVGDLYGFRILRQKQFPAFCYDPHKDCQENQRPGIKSLVTIMEREALSMEQAKLLLKRLSDHLKNHQS